MRLCAISAVLVVGTLLASTAPRTTHRTRGIRAALAPIDDVARDAPPQQPRTCDQAAVPDIRPCEIHPSPEPDRPPEGPPPAAAILVSGLVVDDAGLPIDRAEVRCFDNDGGTYGIDRAVLGTTSTTCGVFAVAIRPERCLRLVVSAKGHAPREWRSRCSDRDLHVRPVLPRLAILDVTTILPDGRAAIGACARLLGRTEIVASRIADEEGRASFALDPDRCLTLLASCEAPRDPHVTCRPVSLRGRVAAGSRTEIVLRFEEVRWTTIEIVAMDGTGDVGISIDGQALLVERGMARRDVRTGEHHIALRDRDGRVVAERHIWVPSHASILREVVSAR